MSGAIFLLAVGLLLLLIRVFHLASQAIPPTLHYRQSSFNSNILKKCSLLLDAYVPPLLWGKSGHLQTIIYGKMGRINSPFPKGERKFAKMSDGATMSYDIFEPHVIHPSQGDFTLLLCPGIANSSESLYICTCVHNAQLCGYRVAVLNHLGAIKNVPLTSDRMFNYGSTDEFGEMVDGIKLKYADTKCIAIGFSMGGNILLKWLGESQSNQAKVLAAMSCCQGYDIEKVSPLLLSWEHLRRIYLYAMTLNQKQLLNRHRDVLLGKDAVSKYGLSSEEQIHSSTSLQHIDKHYTVPRFGFSNTIEYYQWASCVHKLNNINIPLLLLNALDDPIVPPDLLHIPKQLALNKDNVIFAVTHHGGHLGFYEGGLVYPDTITWLDKIVVQYADAIVDNVHKTAQSNHDTKDLIGDSLRGRCKENGAVRESAY